MPYSTDHDKLLLVPFWVSQEIVHVGWLRNILPTDCDALECEVREQLGDYLAAVVSGVIEILQPNLPVIY